MYDKADLEIDIQYLYGQSFGEIERKKAKEFIKSIIKQSGGRLR